MVELLVRTVLVIVIAVLYSRALRWLGRIFVLFGGLATLSENPVTAAQGEEYFLGGLAIWIGAAVFIKLTGQTRFLRWHRRRRYQQSAWS